MPTPPLLRGTAYTHVSMGGCTMGRVHVVVPYTFIVVPLDIVVPVGRKARGLYGVASQE